MAAFDEEVRPVTATLRETVERVFFLDMSNSLRKGYLQKISPAEPLPRNDFGPIVGRSWKDIYRYRGQDKLLERFGDKLLTFKEFDVVFRGIILRTEEDKDCIRNLCYHPHISQLLAVRDIEDEELDFNDKMTVIEQEEAVEKMIDGLMSKDNYSLVVALYADAWDGDEILASYVGG